MEARITLDMATTLVSAGNTVFDDHSRVETETRDEDLYQSSAKRMRGPIRKSCDTCFKRKKKCDGDGVNRCSYCASKGRMDCMYDERWKPTEVRLRQKRLDCGADNGGAPTTPRATFRRCRMSASLATGLVGMEENALLRDFFTCMSYIPLTNPSQIREAMVNIMSSRGPTPTPGHETFVASGISLPSWQHDSGGNSRTGVAYASSNAMVCTFWCTVALGGLLQGRPESLVAHYLRLAEDALTLCEGQAGIEVARALGIMAVLYSFLDRDQGDVAACLEHRLQMISEVETEESKQLMGEEFITFAQYVPLEGIDNFLEKAEKFFVFSEQRSSIPRFQYSELREDDLYSLTVGLGTRMWGIILKTMKETETHIESPPSSDDEDHFTGSCHRFKANAPESQTGPARYAPVRAFFHDHAGDVELLKREAKRSALPTGLTVILNGVLSFVSLFLGNREGVIEATYKIVEMFFRYPGLGRFILFRMTYSLITLYVASVGDYATYGELKAGFNQLWSDEKTRIPPLEERLERFLWDDVMWCRIQEQLVREHGWGTVASPGVSARPGEACSGDDRTSGCRDSETHHFNDAKSCHDAHCSRTSSEEASLSAPAGVSSTKASDTTDHQLPIVVDVNDWNYLAESLQA